MKLHMIGGPYAGCVLDDDVWPVMLRPTVSLPAMAASHPAEYRMETLKIPALNIELRVVIHIGSSILDAMHDLLATHREISEQKGPASSLKGRLPRGIS